MNNDKGYSIEKRSLHMVVEQQQHRGEKKERTTNLNNKNSKTGKGVSKKRITLLPL